MIRQLIARRDVITESYTWDKSRLGGVCFLQDTFVRNFPAKCLYTGQCISVSATGGFTTSPWQNVNILIENVAVF